MGKIATHTNPVYRPTPSFILSAMLGDLSDGAGREQLWSQQVGDDLYKLCCIPFFAYDMALGDTVRADSSKGYVIQLVAERSGNGVVRVAISDPKNIESAQQPLHDILEKLEYLHEWYAPGYVSINFDFGRSHNEIFAELSKFSEVAEFDRFLV